MRRFLIRATGLCSAVALSAAFVPARLLAAPSSTNTAPDATAPAVIFEIETAPTITDAGTLSEWIRQECLGALAELEPSPDQRGTIRVAVSGALYDYQVSITVIRESSTDEDARSWSCECSNDVLLARIRTDVQSAAKMLEHHASRHVDTESKAPPPRPVVTHRPSSLLRDLQLRGKLGLGLIVGGSAGAIAGIALIRIGVREQEYEEDSAKQVHKNYRVPGIPTLVVGAGFLVAGATLLILDRRGARLERNLARAPQVILGRQYVLIGLTRDF